MEKFQTNGPVQQKDSGNKKQQNAEKQRREWIGERNLELTLELHLRAGQSVPCEHSVADAIQPRQSNLGIFI